MEREKADPPAAGTNRRGALAEVFRAAFRLGLTSFGGPIAHLAYFRGEYVERRRWLDDRAYADLAALCQFLPGPASSQVGIAIGMGRAGFWGGVASWLGFTLPSALALFFFGHALRGAALEQAGWLRGLLIVAVVVVAQAVWGMATQLAPDRARATIALGGAVACLTVPSTLVQVMVIGVAGLIGWRFLAGPEAAGGAASGAGSAGDPPSAGGIPGHGGASGGRAPVGPRAAFAAWGVFFGLLIGLPLARTFWDAQWLAVFDTFFRAGSLVFGGGHVVLPLLQTGVVTPGWVTADQFVAGYGAAQAVPGPLFTFAAYLGGVMGGWRMAVLATAAIFLPSFLLIAGALPFWESIRRRRGFQSALRGINAAVVGILLAAFYDPVWTKAIQAPGDFALALAAFGLLVHWKAPPWAVVALSALAGAVLYG